MTEFSSLRQAIDFRTACPLCSGKMVIDERFGIDIKTDYSWDFREKTILTWNTAHEEVTVDVDIGVIRAVSKNRSAPVYGANFSGSVATYTHTPIHNGILYLRLGMGCGDCDRYSYLVQILVDASCLKIVSLPLNSETIVLVNEGLTHEVKNIYTTNETEYNCFRNFLPVGEAQVGNAPVVFPLMPLDLADPWKIVNRIRNLIVFS